MWVNRTGKHVDDRIGLGNQWSYAIVSGLSGDHWPFLFLVEPISQLFTDCYSIMINVYFISDNGTLMNRHRNMRDDVTESSVLYIISDPLTKSNCYLSNNISKEALFQAIFDRCPSFEITSLKMYFLNLYLIFSPHENSICIVSTKFNHLCFQQFLRNFSI